MYLARPKEDLDIDLILVKHESSNDISLLSKTSLKKALTFLIKNILYLPNLWLEIFERQTHSLLGILSGYVAARNVRLITLVIYLETEDDRHFFSGRINRVSFISFSLTYTYGTILTKSIQIIDTELTTLVLNAKVKTWK